MTVRRTRGSGTPESGWATGGPRARPVASRRKGKRRKPAKAKRSRRGLYLGLAYWGTITCLWGALVLGAFTLYVVNAVPDPVVASLDERSPTVTVLAADGTVMAQQGLRPGYVPLKQMPRHLVQAVLATEDRRFYSHMGVDPLGLLRAAFENLRAGDIVEGGSTITQQLAKNLFLTPERTIWRKVQEVVLAAWLEARYSKDKILELYLNRVYLGAGAYGVEAAARRYFAKSARDVTLPEAAMLAGLLKAPSRYAPTTSMERADARASQVLMNMADAGYLSSRQAMAAIAAPAQVENPSGVTGYEYATDWVADLLPGFVGERDEDLIVETTIDARLQRAAQRTIGAVMDGAGARADAAEGAAVLMDTSGAVRAIAGGRSYARSQYNRAVKSLRQPGSTFKPFVFLAALETGMTPDTITYDEPITINGWTPKNYKDEYRGAITLREALADSVNTVAVRLAVETGRGRVLRTARRLGITSPMHTNPSLALGTAEVSLLELTGAYVPFANGGRAVLPHVIERVRTGRGKTIYRRRGSRLETVLAPHHVGAMNEMLNATLIEGTGRRAALAGRPAAGKTGTSQNFRDAWFVGYTGQYVAGVWVGNDDGSPMNHVTGGSLPAAVWHDLMTQAHEGLPVLPLPGTRSSEPAVADGGWQVSGERPALLPWQQPAAQPRAEPFYRRVLGFLGG